MRDHGRAREAMVAVACHAGADRGDWTVEIRRLRRRAVLIRSRRCPYPHLIATTAEAIPSRYMSVAATREVRTG
jgi:hypothetical protein